MKRKVQVQESKQWIAEALFKLMGSQALETITITQLVKEAQLTRMTFYRHFASIDDVLNFSLTQIVDEIRFELNKIPEPDLSDLLLLRFKVLYRHVSRLKFNTQSNLDYLIERFRAKQVKIFFGLFKSDLSPFELHYHMGGIDAVTRQWINEGMKQSPEEITQAIMKLIQG